MAWAYSQDLRDRVLAAVDEGLPVYQAAPLYRVSVSFIYKLLARREQTGLTGPSATKGHRPRKLAGHEQTLRRYVEEHNDATLHEIQEWLGGRGGMAEVKRENAAPAMFPADTGKQPRSSAACAQAA